MPPGTRLVAGQWWPASYTGKPLASLDRKLARGMGLALGDTVTINILGENLDVTIASLREVNYMSLRINFALIFSPGAIEHFPASGLTTMHVDGVANETSLLREITRKFPNISAIHIRETLVQLQEVVGHIGDAIRLTAFFCLICGVMVLGSAITATLERRSYDTMMFKVLGAKKKDILAVFLIEWMCIAAAAGLLSCFFGTLGARLILSRLEWFEFHMLYGVMAGALLFTLLFIACTGLLLHSRGFALKATATLRNE
jgi:putative ABC transport system permease protein